MKNYKLSEESIPTKIIHEGEIIASPKIIAEEMNKFFIKKVKDIHANVNTRDTDPMKILEACIKKPLTSFRFKSVHTSAVFEAIMSLKSTKSSGADNITSIFLKKIPQISLNIICHLYNNIVASSKFPSCLKISRVLP